MSGHSKWATTKHKKAAIDAKRAKAFAKYIKGIEVAARQGGADTAGNPALDLAVSKAKKNSVPNDNIDRAVKRGSGAEAGGADWENITYEGYAPGGVAILIECLTDNKNRAATEVRTALSRNGGSLADPNSVAYLFNRKGVVMVPKAEKGEDELLEIVGLAGLVGAMLSDVLLQGFGWAGCLPAACLLCWALRLGTHRSLKPFAGRVAAMLAALGAQSLLARAAAEVGAQLVVLGTRKRTPVGKFLLGSTVQKVIIDAVCPVLCVKAEY